MPGASALAVLAGSAVRFSPGILWARLSSGRHLAASTMQDLLYAAVAVLMVITLIVATGWAVEKQRRRKLEKLSRQAVDIAHQREKERDLAQDELFRRLCEERELVQEKTQFHAQLADYEKYAALAQLALGAAHEINNPLLGILSHLELELKAASGEEERIEIEQCIEGAKRISSTKRW